MLAVRCTLHRRSRHSRTDSALVRRLLVPNRMTVTKISAVVLLLAAVAIQPGVAEAKDLVIHQQGDVSYVSGGVGEEKEALAAASNRFNLKVTMALGTGHFVGDARVLIEDAHGRPVLDTTAD